MYVCLLHCADGPGTECLTYRNQNEMNGLDSRQKQSMLTLVTTSYHTVNVKARQFQALSLLLLPFPLLSVGVARVDHPSPLL